MNIDLALFQKDRYAKSPSLAFKKYEVRGSDRVTLFLFLDTMKNLTLSKSIFGEIFVFEGKEATKFSSPLELTSSRMLNPVYLYFDDRRNAFMRNFG